MHLAPLLVFVRRALGIAALAVISACGGGGGGGSMTPPPVGSNPATPLPATLAAEVPATAEVGAAVTLKTGLPAAAADLRYDWDLGDGQRSTDAQPAHAWTVAGRYSWRVTVRNGDGATVSAGGSVQVGWFARLNGAICTGASQTGWCQVAASDFFATDVRCADAQHCVAVGRAGHVAYTRDGGRSWGLSRIPSIGSTLTHVRMADPDTVYALGGQGVSAGQAIWRSLDGGRHWALVSEPSPPVLQSAFGGSGRVWALDAQTLVASAATGSISQDGGVRWTTLTQQVVDITANRFLWSDSMLSSDLGQTWRPVPTGLQPGGIYRDVLAREAGNATPLRLLVRESVPGSATVAPRLLRLISHDGGLTFSEDPVQLPTGIDAMSVRTVLMRPDGTADAVVVQGSQGAWLRSSNFGVDWAAQPLVTGTDRALSAVGIASDGGALVVRVADLALDATGNRGHFELLDLRTGSRTVIEGEESELSLITVDRLGGGVLSKRRSGLLVASSSDLGRTWTALPKAAAGSRAAIGAMLFFDGANGLVTQPLGATRDGGISWQDVPTSTVLWPGDRWRLLPDGSALLLGKPGMYRTADRGLTWTAVPMPEVFDPGVDFIDVNRGWASACVRAADGSCTWHVMRTTDGGQRWDPIWPVPTGAFVHRLRFVSATEGVMQRSDASVWWTADGGLTWVRSRTRGGDGGETDTLANGRIVADRSQTLWMIGGSTVNDVLLRSLDRGRTWRPMALPLAAPATPQVRLTDVASPDGRQVWLVGLGGLLLKSADGGETWRVQDSGTRVDLLNVFALDAQTVWAAGFDLLLSTASGGD